MRRILIEKCKDKINKEVKISGWVHRIRKLKSFSFIILRDRSGLVQCVIDNNIFDSELKLESVISVRGKVVESNNKHNTFEIQGISLEIISKANEEIPIQINSEDLNVQLDTLLNNRVLSLRNEKINNIFKIKNIIVQAFRTFLINEEFTEIHTPKIVAGGAEGGTEIFQLEYFGQKAFLAQSPQFYKQMMVAAGCERVFEVGAVYRAEQHSTVRHLNEYISMDLEMGFIESEDELMDLEEKLLKHIMLKLKENGEKPLRILNVELPVVENIPRIKFSEAKRILFSEYGMVIENDLSPEGEKKLSGYAFEKYGCEFLFVTHYPRIKRPMYTMPYGEEETRSFDLLFRGLEITTGGLRINEYNALVKGFKNKGLNPEDFESYLNTFKWGVPPHGGLAIGLERLTIKILGLGNIREATLFPRDKNRLIP